MNLIKPLVPIAFMLVAAPALAGTPISNTRPLAPQAELTVDNVAGAVIIHTWDKHQLRITGTLGNNAHLKITGDAHDLTVKVKTPGSVNSGWFHWNSSSAGPTTLKLTVPKGVELKVHTVSAHIKANGLDGGEIDAKSVSGNIAIDAHSPDMDIHSVSGDIHLTGSTREADVNTVSGDIRVQQVGHEASAQSVSGDIHLAGGPLEEVSMESVSGDLFLTGSLATDGSADLHSMSGDIHLTLNGQPHGKLTASSFSGDIHSPWGKANEPEYGPGSSLSTRLGAGSAHIKLKTFSGDVDIRQGH